MKSVLLSIKPYWVFLIIAKTMGWQIDKQKTVEVRKSYPKDENWNKKVIVYCTKDYKSFNKIPKEYQPQMEKFLGKVIGEFVCDEISKFTAEFVDDDCYEDIRYCYDTLDGDEDELVIATNEDEKANNNWLCKSACLTFNDIKKYIGVNFHEIPFYGWHISDLVIYDKPKELSEFYKSNILSYDDWLYGIYNGRGGATASYESYKNIFRLKRPPQSWCYVEELK